MCDTFYSWMVDSRIWWWFGDKFNALIKNPNGKDSIEGDVLSNLSPLNKWETQISEDGISTYTWIIVLLMDGDSRIWWWFGDKFNALDQEPEW